MQIASPRQCTVQITNPNTDWDTTLTFSSGESNTVYLGSCYRSCASDTIHGFVFHVSSTDSISLFASVGNGIHYDKSIILPTSQLDDEYIVQTFGQNLWGSEFQVVAVEDNTVLSITPSVATRSGRPPNVPYTVTIPQAGQSLQVLSSNNKDFTGTVVKSLNDKPFALFQGVSIAFVRPQYTPNYNAGSYLFEQAVPTSKWGRHFVLPHTDIGRSDYVVVLSSSDSCKVFKDGQLVATLNAGEKYGYRAMEFSSTEYIETSKRACVSIFPQDFYDEAVDGYWYRISSMITIQPWEWRTKNSYFSTKSTVAYYDSMDRYFHVVVKSNDVDSVILNGESISNLFQSIPSAPQFKHAKVVLPYLTTFFHIECNNCEGFTGYVLNRNMVTSGFMIGSALPEIWNMLKVNDVYMEGTSDHISVCLGDSVSMLVKTRYGNDSVRWYFGDGTTATGDTVFHVYQDGGMHLLTAIAYASCDSCYNSIDTLQTYIVVRETDTSLIDTVICGDTWVWHDSTYTDGDQITRLYHNSYGCDSNVVISLHLSGINTTITDTLFGCDSVVFLGDRYGFDAVVPYDTVPNAYGCDSILIMAIDVEPSYDIVQEITIDDISSFTWIDGNTYYSTTDAPRVVFESINGCDSTIHLHLVVRPFIPTPIVDRLDSNAVWVPNAFTPEENDNNLFKIFCNDIVTAEVSIYTRQGLHVCTFDGMSSGWDGTYNGHLCPQGAYLYIITYTTKSCPQYTQQKKGTVLLLR